jgi:hypothetical protein
MNTAEMKERIAESSPRFKSAITGVFYLVTIVMGGVVFFLHGRMGMALDVIATTVYIAVTALFYDLSR